MKGISEMKRMDEHEKLDHDLLCLISSFLDSLDSFSVLG